MDLKRIKFEIYDIKCSSSAYLVTLKLWGLLCKNFLVIAKQSKIKMGVIINSDLGWIEEICWELDAMLLWKTFLCGWKIQFSLIALILDDELHYLPQSGLNPLWSEYEP